MNVTSTGIAVALAVVVAFGFLVFGPGMFNPLSPINQDESQGFLASTTMTGALSNPDNQPLTDNLPTELTITDVTEGTGPTATSGSQVSVRYVGMLPNGTVFDASERHGNEPFTFTLGAGDVIPGWDQGVAGMKVGGVRRLVIPPSLAYGDRDLGVIPPNSTLIFDVELVSVNGQ